MLNRLTIQNVVLIDRLTLEGERGLAALTGETGAGKSILLDALGLALGARADAGLVRHGEEALCVTAEFELPQQHPVHDMLRQKGLPVEAAVILRRTVNKDGRSKAFINDAAVGVQLLKDIGAGLVEIHSQHETHGLLDPINHRRLLDAYAGIAGDVTQLQIQWDAWQNAKVKLEQAKADVKAIKLQEDYLRHVTAELEKLEPQEGEEAVLAEKRHKLMAEEKARQVYEAATGLVDGDSGILTQLNSLLHTLERNKLTALSEAAHRAKAEMEEVSFSLGKLFYGEKGAERLEDVEDRYFALKEAARKHRCAPDDLPRLWQEFAQKLRLITHQDDALAEMEKAVATARKGYLAGAEKISAIRAEFAQKLSAAVMKELPDLKLDKAKIKADCQRHADESAYGAEGIDAVQFMVSTNSGTPFAPLHKTASGGEMSRFMLALKVVLAETGSVPTLIFDEVDTGIGGATADAVGERLARLAKKYQVLCVTHSPQVAAQAAHHWHVAKYEKKDAVFTTITSLKSMEERQEEIARMLSGAIITPEARAQAARLMGNGKPSRKAS